MSSFDCDFIIFGGEKVYKNKKGATHLKSRQRTRTFALIGVWRVLNPATVGDEVPGAVAVLCVYMGGWV